MSSAYRTELIPRWVWVMIIIAGLLILLVAFSVALAEPRQRTVYLGPQVETGDPQDFIRQPEAPAPPPPAPTPPAPEDGIVIEPGAPPTTPIGLPANFVFQGRTYEFSSGPVDVDVQTTGEHTDGLIIYSRAGDEPPFGVVYLEPVPNSGEFYTYVPVD